MVLKIVIILTLLQYTVCRQNYACNQRSVVLLLKRPAYDFSMNILERVAQNNGAHFGFSPLTTWLQLNALAEGGKGQTFRELRAWTKNHRQRCFKQKFARIVNKMRNSLLKEYRSKSVIAVNKNLQIDKKYTEKVKRFYGINVLLENFETPVTAAANVNNFISKGTSGVINEPINPEDFYNAVMIFSDNVFLKSAWKHPFNPAYTNKELFTSTDSSGFVNMMSVTGYYNMTELPHINAKVLEIPCIGDFAMLIFMPLRDFWIGDMFYNLKTITLNTIYNRFKMEGEKLLTVKLPRFRINSYVDNLPELLYDMGIKNVFNIKYADLTISKNSERMYVSSMTQASDVEITEIGVRANVSADLLINETRDSLKYIANKPFAYIFIDRKTKFILYGGAYSVPSIY